MKAFSEAQQSFLNDTILRMDFLQFLAAFGMLYDQSHGKYVHWFSWPKQQELCHLMDTWKIIWVMKARQLGISEMMALYAIFVAMREQKSEIIIISKKLPDAKYFLRKRTLTKLEAMYNLEWEPEKKLPWIGYTPFEGKIEFENGSWIEAASSDNEEVRSHTPRLILFDEIRTFAMADATELWTAIKPSIREQPRSQAICVSTAKHGTWFNRMTKKIKSKELQGIKYFFMPGNARPDRTPEWYAEQLKREPDHKLFYREYPRNEDDCFASREGAVWPQFEPKAGGRHVNRFEINFIRMRYIVVYDHGRQHPACLMMALYDKFSDHLYVFDEVYIKGKEITEVAFEIRKKLNYYRKFHNAPKPALAIADTACFAKDGRRPVADTLRSVLGINFKKSIKHDMDGSIDLVGARMSNAGITIDPRCENTIRQIHELCWKYDAEEKKTEKPIDIEDDLPDCLRYLVSELHAVPRPEDRKPDDQHFNPRFSRHKRELRRELMREMREGYYEPKTINDYTQEELEAWQGL